MRLWHYELIPVLPNKMLIAQWRECIAIKRQWEKGTLKHRLVSYVKYEDIDCFYWYVWQVVDEMNKRNIKYQTKFYEEIQLFCKKNDFHTQINYPEHNDKYLLQCYYNLQEKYDREIISEDEWQKINTIIKVEKV